LVITFPQLIRVVKWIPKDQKSFFLKLIFLIQHRARVRRSRSERRPRPRCAHAHTQARAQVRYPANGYGRKVYPLNGYSGRINVSKFRIPRVCNVYRPRARAGGEGVAEGRAPDIYID